MENNLSKFGKKIFFQFRTSTFFKFDLGVLKLCPLLEIVEAKNGNIAPLLNLWQFGFLEAKLENILFSFENGSNISPLLAISC